MVSTQEDIQIAKMVLAGWRFVPIQFKHSVQHYMILSPGGGFCGYRSTRYTAALAAEQVMEEHGIGVAP